MGTSYFYDDAIDEDQFTYKGITFIVGMDYRIHQAGRAFDDCYKATF